jgi:hypothetical protein
VAVGGAAQAEEVVSAAAQVSFASLYTSPRSDSSRLVARRKVAGPLAGAAWERVGVCGDTEPMIGGPEPRRLEALEGVSLPEVVDAEPDMVGFPSTPSLPRVSPWGCRYIATTNAENRDKSILRSASTCSVFWDP